jgi:glycosyltransferase involved in cell wall biosynthesis
MQVEILYCAWNRLEFTRASFELLSRNTDWSKVTRLVVYDDGSEDGTLEFLTEAGIDLPVPAYEVRHGGWHSTGTTMNDFVALTEAERFVKIDNDIAMPPGWLNILLDVAARNPDTELLGMEAGWTGPYRSRQPSRHYTVIPAEHIGGIGLMQTQAFIRRRPIPASLGKNGRAGFTIWQHRCGPTAGWIAPDLAVVQLDRIPEEPWETLSARYVEEGWARAWEPYRDDMRLWWKWLPRDVFPKVHVA